MTEYKPNSHRSKELTSNNGMETKRKMEKVISGKAIKKKNGMRKIVSALVAEEDTGSLKSYIIWDVLIPAGKRMIQETVDTILNGTGSRKTTNASKISYNGYYGRDMSYHKASGGRRGTRSGYSYEDVIVETRGEAEEILRRMDEAIEIYSVISVADLYDLAGVPSDYTDNKYGWKNIRNAEVVNVGDGYMIKMPRAVPID